ncbi:papilin isoform X3 [Hemitrygon akajei]|uniref:papilin isoform X3 n=1 Tax=Hemitrygon akajei TaxID=2704970 RepID=UPI003BFA25AC
MLPLQPLPVALLLTWVSESLPVRKNRQADYWGPWGEWGECSRTCGIGVTFRERRCYLNRRAGGSSCLGPLRDYRVCNMQDCLEGSRDFREDQCSAFDGTDFQGKRYKWLPYYGASNKCELNCIPQGENFYYRHSWAVKDGTLCEPGHRHICIQGICKTVGCDNTLESLQTEDKCLECGGDGSSCYEVGGIFDTVDLPKAGYNQIHVIPIGAMSIHIREVLPTRNFLALRNAQGEYYLNGEWTIDYSRTLHIASTLLHYARGSEGDLAPEVIHARGPTSEPLILEIISQEPNHGIEYKYYLSRRRKQSQGYIWSVGSWSVCSKECGGGFQTRLVFCTIDDEAYPDYLCREQVRPSNNKTCNPQSCPRTKRWKTGGWSRCSVTCGGGMQTRSVYCSLSDSSGRELVWDDSDCAAIREKPPSQQVCNLRQCASWSTGHWSQCSVTCGEGFRSRTLSCVTPSGSQLPDFACSSQSKPTSTQTCVLQSCRDMFSWYIGAWGSCSVSCGEGFQSRPVSCMSQQGGQLPDSACSSQPKPAAIQTCIRNHCRVFSWHVGAWGLCSKSCALGHRKRQVICYDQDRNNQDPSKCDPRMYPRETEVCNTQPCYLPQVVPSFQDPTGFDPEEEFVTIPHIDSLSPSARLFPEFLPVQAETNLLPASSAPQESELSWFQYYVSESDSLLNNPSRTESRQEPLSRVLDCNTQTYGCCPDGYAAARGPGGAGCPLIPCYKSRYGCCPDGLTSARGFNQLGCPRHPTDDLLDEGELISEPRVMAQSSPPDECRSSMYGCCQDEASFAQGPSGEGCRDRPNHSYPSHCQLLFANGPCTDWTVRWFFIPESAVCNRFWYGGCHGNQNNFETEDECLRQCKRTALEGSHTEWQNQAGRSSNSDPSPSEREQPVYRLQIDRGDPVSVEARLGETARLLCRVDASPSLHVEWRRNGRPVYSPRHSKHSDDSLVISQVQQQDAGLYTCQASNGRDQDVRQVELKVQGELEIIEPPRNSDVTLGGRTELSCVVSDSRAHVRWTRNGIPVRVDTNHISISPGGTLTLHNAQLRDAGTYTCNAYSGSRSVSASAELTVTSAEATSSPTALDSLCVDLPELANCDLIMQANLCSNQYHASFCCSTCSKHLTHNRLLQQG